MNPLVSVIIPVYNVERYLARCLDSVLTQSYVHMEVIAVNDGSTDQSAVLLEEYQKQYPELIVIHQKNQGLSAARNTGMVHASGTYVTFVDSDDYLHKQAVEVMVEAMEDGIDVVEMMVYEAYDDHVIEAGYQTPFAISNVDFDEHPEALLQIGMYAWAKLYRKEMIEALPFPVGLMHEDNYFTGCLLPRLKKIKKIQAGGYYYYQRQNSITTAYNTNMYDMLEIQKQLYAYYQVNAKKDLALCEKMAVRNLAVAIVGKKMAYIKPELRTTRKAMYDRFRFWFLETYPQWGRNPYVTAKERIFVSALLFHYGIASAIWKGRVLRGRAS